MAADPRSAGLSARNEDEMLTAALVPSDDALDLGRMSRRGPAANSTRATDVRNRVLENRKMQWLAREKKADLVRANRSGLETLGYTYIHQ